MAIGYKWLVFLLILGFHQNVRAEDPNFDDCDQKLRDELTKLIQDDKNGILKQQFKVTTLKITKKTLAAKKVTLEQYVKSQSELLKSMDLQNPDTLKKLEEIYDKNSTGQVRSVYNHIEDLKNNAADASYLDSKKRLKNLDVSSLLLYEKMTDPKTEVDKMDVAITWYFQKVSDEVAKSKGANSTTGILTQLSPQLARYTGVIAGTDKISLADLDKEIAASEKALNKLLDGAILAIKKNLAQCFVNEKWKGTCDFNANFISDALSDVLYMMESVNANLGTQLVAQMTRQDNVPIIKPEPAPVKVQAPVTSSSKKVAAKPAAKPGACGVARSESGNACIEPSLAANQIKGVINALGSKAPGSKAGAHKHRGGGKPEFMFKLCTKKISECCGKSVKNFQEYEVEVFFGSEFTISLFVGVPYGAELGVRGSLNLGAAGNINYAPSACGGAEGCGKIGLKIEPGLAVYAEVLAGLGGIEGNIKWKPSGSVSQCFGHQKRPLVFEAALGKIDLGYKATLAWAFTWEDSMTVYEFESKWKKEVQVF